MPYLGCKDCHHEWESAKGDYAQNKCDWCGGDSYILEVKTPLENLGVDKIFKIMEDLKKKNGEN